MAKLLCSHIETIRRNEFLKHAWIVFIWERNTAFESSHQWEMVRHYPKTYALYQHAKPKSKARGTPNENPGVFTDYYYKNQYAMALSSFLKNRSIRYMENCISAAPWRPAASAFAETKAELESQLQRCRPTGTLPTVDTRVPRLGWSGKTGADGQISPGLNDDLAVCLAMTTYWTNRIITTEYPGFEYGLVFGH